MNYIHLGIILGLKAKPVKKALVWGSNACLGPISAYGEISLGSQSSCGKTKIRLKPSTW